MTANKFAGTCACGVRVEAGLGSLVRNGTGGWLVLCPDCQDPPKQQSGSDQPDAGNVVDLHGAPVRYTLLSGHPASAHQAAVFDALADQRSGSKLVIAVAGAGKTTVIKNGLRFLRPGCHVQGFAFNVEASQSLKDALDEVRAAMGEAHCRNMRMGTFHSVGHYAVKRFLGREVTVERGKLRKLLQAWLSPEGYDLYGSFVQQLVGLAQGEGIGALVPDTEERWFNLILHHGLYLDSEEATEAEAIRLAREALERSVTQAKDEAIISHDDQLYLVLRWKLRLWQNDVVFVDEAQDTNPVRRAIARLALKPDGRLFAVGDPKQSIYGFTGASTDAMDLIAREFNAKELPLTVSYRCARSIVRQAQTWVDYIQPADGAPEGEVRHDVPLKEALALLTTADAVLCRQTAPLVDLAFQQIAAGRGVHLLGRDLGEGLLNLIRAQKARGLDRLVLRLERFREREVARFTARGEEDRAEAVSDRVACVLAVATALPETERTIPALERQITDMFRLDRRDDESAAGLLTLATLHKAKGKEYDTVLILRPDLMPSRAARQEWQMEQEDHLQYVGATRAKRVLLYARVEDAR